MSSDLELPVTHVHRDEQTGESRFEPIKMAIITPSLTPVAYGTIEDDVEDVSKAKPGTSRPLIRTRLRKALVVATYAAIGSTFAWLALLDARGEIHGKEIHHEARVAEVSAIQTVLSVEETLGLKSPPPTPMVVEQLDAPWSPAAANAKPWTPAPYASIQLPTAAAAAPSAPIVTPTAKKPSIAKPKKHTRHS